MRTTTETTRMRVGETQRNPFPAPNLVRWGAIAAGTFIALGFFATFSSLWVAIAYSDNDGSGWISGNLPWWLAGTAIVALFLAGLLSAFFSGVRGALAGVGNGMTSWGLLFILSTIVVVPGLAALTTELTAGIGAGTNEIAGSVGQPGGGVTAENAVWATFWSLLIGAFLAAAGGLVGGLMRRDTKVSDIDVRGEHDVDVYPGEPATSVRTDELGATERHETAPRR